MNTRMGDVPYLDGPVCMCRWLFALYGLIIVFVITILYANGDDSLLVIREVLPRRLQRRLRIGLVCDSCTLYRSSPRLSTRCPRISSFTRKPNFSVLLVI